MNTQNHQNHENQSQPQSKKKKMKPVTIVLIVCAALIFCAGIGIFSTTLFNNDMSQASEYITSGEFDKAKEILEKQLDANGSQEKVYLVYADFYLAQGQYLQALDILEKGIKRCSSDDELQGKLDKIRFDYAEEIKEMESQNSEEDQTEANNESEQTNTGNEGESEIILKPSPIAFIKRTYEMDFLGGVQWTFEIKNNSEKEIKYVTLEWSCCDSVGEPIYDDITGKNLVAYKFPGPWESGETKRYQTPNTSKFYNHAYAQSKLVTIKVEFMDGEIVDINSKEYTDIFKTTSLNIPTLPYTVNTDTDLPCCTITKIEYEFFDYTTYHTDGKFITNDFEISIYGEYDEGFDRNQYQLVGNLINSKGETIFNFIVDFDYSGRYHKRALDSIDPGETYTLEFCYESK